MKISEILKELSKLDLRTSVLFMNNDPIRFDDLLYIRIREGKVKSYTVLKLRSITYSDGYYEYLLADEFDHTCTVGRGIISLYRGQNLKIQRVYDFISNTIILLLMSALLSLTKLFPELWELLLG